MPWVVTRRKFRLRTLVWIVLFVLFVLYMMAIFPTPFE